MTPGSPHRVTTRPVRPSDTPVLREIELKSFQSDPWSEGDFLEHECLVALIPEAGQTPLSRDREGAVSSISASNCAPNAPTPANHSAAERVIGYLVSHEVCPPKGGQPAEREILNIAVGPEFRRQGVARCLLVKELSRGGIHFLEVRESNLAARTLYERQGFETVGRRKAYYESPREAAILMRHLSL
jgi:ribosomal protein S18 acetylase RimI-like enzyme